MTTERNLVKRISVHRVT